MNDGAEPVRLGPFKTLLGANWIAPHSVLGATAQGSFAPGRWRAIPDLLGPLLPAGLPDIPFPPIPDGIATAVEVLARYLLAIVDHPPPALVRTAAGRAALHVAAIPLGSAALAAAAVGNAARLLDQAAVDREPDAQWSALARDRLAQFRREAEEWLPYTRRFLVRAAEARGIPWQTVRGVPQLFLFGEGRHGRRFNATSTWRTGVIGATIAANKRHGHAILRDGGLPVARQEPVQSIADVHTAAAAFGLPMVLKPIALRHGQGVRIIYHEREIEAAWTTASGFAQPVVAESYIPGDEHRVLVVTGEVVAVVMRLPAMVTGDGRSSIRQLIEQLNADPLRGSETEGFTRPRFVIDEQGASYLAAAGRSYDSVPADGEAVQIHPLPVRRVGSPGRVDVTHRLHPDNRDMALRAVAAFGLDLAGIDLRMPDIARSWREVGAGICEVNPQPNLQLHYGIGSDLDVAGILLDRCYPPAERGPMRHVLLVSDDDLSAHLAAAAAALRRRFGWRVGTVGREGVDLDGWTPGRAARSLPDAHGLVVSDPTLDAAVYAVPPGVLAGSGLGARRLDAAFFGTGPEPAMGLARAVAEGLGLPCLPLPAHPEATAAAVIDRLERAVAGS